MVTIIELSHDNKLNFYMDIFFNFSKILVGVIGTWPPEDQAPGLCQFLLESLGCRRHYLVRRWGRSKIQPLHAQSVPDCVHSEYYLLLYPDFGDLVCE